jgi:hypothetical protein
MLALKERETVSEKRERNSAAYMAKVAVEALRGLKTTAELASQHRVHPSQINDWQRHALEKLATLLESARPGPGGCPSSDSSSRARGMRP